MSKRIFELQNYNPSVIMDSKEESVMQKDQNHYTQQLEDLVLKLLPVYDRYYEVIGAPKPPLEIQILKKIRKKQAALFRPWPLKD